MNTRRIRRERCPRCGSMNTGKYVFGYPAPELFEEEEQSNGAIILGGCCVPLFRENLYHCHNCRKDFGGHPEYDFKSKQEGRGDCVLGATKISFEIDGSPDTCGYAVRITPHSLHLESHEKFDPTRRIVRDIAITTEDFLALTKRLFLKLYVADWKREYGSRDTMDGDFWALTIDFYHAKRPLFISGVDSYPPYYKRLLNLLRPLFHAQGLSFAGDDYGPLPRQPQWDSCKTMGDVMHEAAQLALDEFRAGHFSAAAAGIAFDYSWAMQKLRVDRVLHYLRMARQKANTREIIDSYLWNRCADLVLKRDAAAEEAKMNERLSPNHPPA